MQMQLFRAMMGRTTSPLRARVSGYRYVGNPLATKGNVGYNSAVTSFKADIRSGAQPLQIVKSLQERHVFGSPGYVEGRSYIYGRVEDAQKLVNQYAGTGWFIPTQRGAFTKQELISTSAIIGRVQDTNGEWFDTTRFKIHYRRTGTHLVPTLRSKP